LNLSAHHPVLLVVVPLGFAAICPLLGAWRRSLCFWWALAGAAATAFLSWSLIGKVSSSRPLTYGLGDWSPPWGIQIRVDVPAVVMCCAVTGIILAFVVYSYRHAREQVESPSRLPYYYTLMLLVTAGMLGVLITDDLFNLLVVLEVTCIAACGLVAVAGAGDALRSSLKYLFAVAASGLGFMLAIGFLYSVTGTLDMRQLPLRIDGMASSFVPVVVVALALFLLALAVQAALFPASWWLPDLAVSGFDPAGALASSLVVAMASFAMFRVLFVVFPPSLARVGTARTITSTSLAWVGVIAFVVGAVMMALEKDLKRLVGYAAISQVGLVVLGIAASSARAVAGGLVAAVAGACTISCLFLGCGALTYGTGMRTVADIRGLGRRRPVAAAAFTLGALSLVGVPLTVGFAAKRLVLQGLFDKGWYVPAALVLLGTASVLAACARLVFLLYARGGRAKGGSLQAAPATMTLPVAAVAASLVVLGALSYLVTPSIVAAVRALVLGT
jgi:multicomponent Na+:H+ antiporter subunit D